MRVDLAVLHKGRQAVRSQAAGRAPLGEQGVEIIVREGDKLAGRGSAHSQQLEVGQHAHGELARAIVPACVAKKKKSHTLLFGKP